MRDVKSRTASLIHKKLRVIHSQARGYLPQDKGFADASVVIPNKRDSGIPDEIGMLG